MLRSERHCSIRRRLVKQQQRRRPVSDGSDYSVGFIFLLSTFVTIHIYSLCFSRNHLSLCLLHSLSLASFSTSTPLFTITSTSIIYLIHLIHHSTQPSISSTIHLIYHPFHPLHNSHLSSQHIQSNLRLLFHAHHGRKSNIS